MQRARQVGGRAAGPVTCCIGALAIAGALVAVAPAGPTAGASQVTSLQAQAAQLSKEMLLEQLQISGYEQQRSSSLAQAAADRQAALAAASAIAATRRRILHDMGELRQAAVTAYVTGGTELAGVTRLFSHDPVDGASAVYQTVMTGDVSAVVDRLRASRRALRADQETRQWLASQASQAASAAAALLADAQSTEQALLQQHADVTGQLAAAIRTQQEAQAVAAAAAIAAAQAQARAAQAQLPPLPALASSAPPAPPTSTAGPPATAPAAGTGALPALPPFLACVLQAESGGDYQAVSPTGQYMGGFQFSQPTWNEAAMLAGRPTLVGIPPNQASPADQDELAIALYAADGEQPWFDPCRTGG